MLEKNTKQVEQTPAYFKRVLNFREAAAHTGYTERGFRQLIAEGKIPCSRPNGKNLYFDRNALDEWMLGNPVTTREKREIEVATYLTTNPQ